MSGLTIAGSGITLVDPTGANITIGVGTTPISGGTTGSLVYDNAGKVGELLMGTGVQTGLTTAVNTSTGFATYPVSLATAGISGILPVANGGTGNSTGQTALNALSGVYVLTCSGTSATTTGTTEATGIQLFANIPANVMGANGVIEVSAFTDNKSGISAATVNLRYAAGTGAGITGTAVVAASVASGNNLWLFTRTANAGATGVQLSNGQASNPTGSTATAYAQSLIDTTTATVVRLNMFMPTGGGTAVIRGWQVKLITNSGT